MSLALLEEHRAVWASKSVLADIYGVWFDALLDDLPTASAVLEVGAGPGFLKERARTRRSGHRVFSSDLLAAPWNDLALAPGNTIRAIHILDLRTFLDDAATRLGYSTSAYADPGLTTGFVIRRIHIEDLRQRIRAIAG